MQLLHHDMSPLEQTHRARGGIKLAGSRRQLSFANQVALKEILTGKYSFVKNPSFSRSNAQRKLFDNAPDIARPDTSWYHPVMETFGDDSTRSSRLGGKVLLTGDEECVLFLQYNYCRYRVCKLREKIGNGPVDGELAMQLLMWHHRAEALRDQIAQTNLALVLAMAKRMKLSNIDFGDMISEGNMALLRAIDKFDVARGFKFSTYACRAILKSFSRAGIKHTRYRTMFPTDFNPEMERSDFAEIRRQEIEGNCADEVRHIFRNNSADLTDIEQEVIEHRFAIDHKGKKQVDSRTLTLEQVGRIIGVTKERVRQIQNKALAKIRQSLEIDYLR